MREQHETVQLTMDHCVGATQYDGTHKRADSHGLVTVDRATAQGLKRSGAARSPRRVFAIPPLPWKQADPH